MLNSSFCRPPAVFHFRRPLASGMNAIMDRAASHVSSNDSGHLVTLLAAVSGGDRQAFSALYDRTSAKLYGICLRLLGSEAEAQDALQDAYVTVWQKAGRFDPARSSAITWLAVVARNKAIDRLRRRPIATDGLDAAADVQDEKPSAFEVVGNSQDAARLRDCLGELEDRPRAMIRSAFLDGATYPQLAEREGVPLATMKSWIRRGLQRLRGCLER